MSIEEKLDEKAAEMEAAENGNGNGHDIDDEDDLLESIVERMSELASWARDGQSIEDAQVVEMQMLHQFSMSAMAHFALEEFADIAERARQLIGKVDSMVNGMPGAMMAGMGAAVAGATPPVVDQADGPPPGFPGFTPPAPPPGQNGVSWLNEVMEQAEEPAQGIPLGKKTLAVEIDCGDLQPCGPEHIAIFRQFQAEGWDLEALNAKLAECARPAIARISNDPAKQG